MREILMILLVTTFTIGSQLLVKAGVLRLVVRDPSTNFCAWLLGVATSPAIVAAVAVQGLGFLLWVVVVTRMKLGAAFAISGGFFYLLIAMASWAFYGERLNALQWVGLLLISSGVVLMTSQANSVA